MSTLNLKHLNITDDYRQLNTLRKPEWVKFSRAVNGADTARNWPEDRVES